MALAWSRSVVRGTVGVLCVHEGVVLRGVLRGVLVFGGAVLSGVVCIFVLFFSEFPSL